MLIMVHAVRCATRSSCNTLPCTQVALANSALQPQMHDDNEPSTSYEKRELDMWIMRMCVQAAVKRV